MKLYALLAALALVAVVAAPPHPVDHRTTMSEVQPAPFSSLHGSYFMPIHDTGTAMQRLFQHSPVDTPDGATAWELVRNPLV